MGILNVQFYAGVARTKFGAATSYMREPNLGTENVTTSAVSAQSAAAPKNTRFVRVTVDVASYIQTGANPVAVAGDILIPANGSMVLGIVKDDIVAARTVAA